MKGCVFFSAKHNNHFAIIASDEVDDKYLLVTFSSVKPNQYFDNACIFQPTEIILENGQPLLSKKSYVRYGLATEITKNQVTELQFAKKLELKCTLNDEQIAKIQNGTKISNEFEPDFLKYIP